MVIDNIIVLSIMRYMIKEFLLLPYNNEARYLMK